MSVLFCVVVYHNGCISLYSEFISVVVDITVITDVHVHDDDDDDH